MTLIIIREVGQVVKHQNKRFNALERRIDKLEEMIERESVEEVSSPNQGDRNKVVTNNENYSNRLMNASNSSYRQKVHFFMV